MSKQLKKTNLSMFCKNYKKKKKYWGEKTKRRISNITVNRNRT